MSLAMDANTIAWLSTLLCTYFAAKCANTFLSSHPRLFTVMALLALVWALLLPYYSSDIQSELLPAYGGFLSVYIGGILVLEASARTQTSHALSVSHFQKLGLWLFLFIAAPSVLALKGPGGNPIIALDPRQAELLIGTLLSILGYVSIAFGCKVLFGNRFFGLIGTVYLFYSGAEIAFTYWSLTHQNRGMNDEFRLLFAGLKLLITVLLGYRVSREGFSKTELTTPLRAFAYRLLPFVR